MLSEELVAGWLDGGCKETHADLLSRSRLFLSRVLLGRHSTSEHGIIHSRIK
jgi:hypothetical protein